MASNIIDLAWVGFIIIFIIATISQELLRKRLKAAQKMQKDIVRKQADLIDDYYAAIYDAKLFIQNRNGLKAPPIYTGRPRTEGNEERMTITNYEGVCKIIENLPLF